MNDDLLTAIADSAHTALMDPATESNRELLNVMKRLHSRTDLDVITKWALQAGIASMQSALDTDDETQARGIAALTLLAFGLEN